MAVFIYEHLTSGALIGSSSPKSLILEGDHMSQAIIMDLLALGCHIVTLRDFRLPALPYHSHLSVLTVNNSNEYESNWIHALKNNSTVLVIAPETDEILFRLTQQAEQCGNTILGSDSIAVAMAGDKLRCYQQLHKNQILTPETYSVTEWSASQHDHQQWIIKPRDGAGCEQTFMLSTTALSAHIQQLENTIRPVIQPYIEGQSLSLSIFVSSDTIELYSINQQVIDVQQHVLSLTQCVTKQSLLDEQVAIALARKVVSAIPGLKGFVGIDLIKQDDKLWVVDVNPRLTSSYAEPPMRAEHNPAELFFRQLPHEYNDV